MTTARTARYRSRMERGEMALELSFRGATELGEDNPRRTQVEVRASRRLAPESWVDVWRIRCGHPKMPGGPWNGFQLTAILDGALFAAWGSELNRLTEETGDIVWQLSTGNTPIIQILATEGLLVVRNSIYRFEDPAGLSNLCAVTPDGQLRWRASAPCEDDWYANRVDRVDGELKTMSWSGLECRLSAADGSILEKKWTR